MSETINAPAEKPNAGRKLVVPSTPKTTAEKPVKVATAKDEKPKVTKSTSVSGSIARTAATIVRGAANFNGLTDRDNAYLSFYASFAKAHQGKVSIDTVVQSGRVPKYAGSAKPHDAGVVQRLAKAGLINLSPDAMSFTFTQKARDLAAYNAG